MNDNELLELAAHAFQLPECGWMGPAFMYAKNDTFTDWNPLTNDSDALHLAVGLLMDVDIGLTCVTINWAAPMADDCRTRVFINIEQPIYTIGIEAATRRAIVRAAAELGKLK